MRRIFLFFALTFVFIATIAIFLPALRNGWVWDDFILLTTNLSYRGFSPVHLRWMFTSTLNGPYQPLPWLTYAADFKLWGLNPEGYHFTNISLHALNAVLFFFIARRLFDAAQVPDTIAAVVAALLFSLHPLRVESVAWASERRDVLCGFFYLSAVWAYLAAAQDGRRRYLPLSWALLVFALLSKAIAVSLPIVLLTLDWYPLRRWRHGADAPVLLLEKLPFAAAAGAVGLLAYCFQTSARATLDVAQHGIAARLSQAAFNCVFYLGKSILPVRLSPLYQLPAVISPVAWPFSAALLATFSITVLAWRLRRDQPYWLAVWVCYCAGLAPVSGLFQAGPQLAADRYSYFPCMALPFLAAGGFSRLARVNPFLRAIVYVSMPLCLICLGALARRQVSIWRDSVTLWSSVLTADPASDYAHNNLGDALAQQSLLSQAAAHFEAALRLNGGCIEAQNRLAEIAGREPFSGEEAKLRRRIEINPVCRQARSNLVTVRAELGDLRGAVSYFTMLLKIEPNNANAHVNLGRALLGLGRRGQAVDQFRSALLYEPHNPVAERNLRIALGS